MELTRRGKVDGDDNPFTRWMPGREKDQVSWKYTTCPKLLTILTIRAQGDSSSEISRHDPRGALPRVSPARAYLAKRGGRRTRRGGGGASSPRPCARARTPAPSTV